MLRFFGSRKSPSSPTADSDADSSSCWNSDEPFSIDAASYATISCTDGTGSTVLSAPHDDAPPAHIQQRSERRKKEETSQLSEATEPICNSRPVQVKEVNYDTECTQLFRLIQNQDWEEAAACAKADPTQIETWVYRKELSHPDKLRWRLLPIHAMCVFLAPESLMELLLDNYPKAASMEDDQGMLPVHLACRNGSNKGVVKILLDAYPEGLHATDRKGRTPLELTKASSNFNKEGIIITLERFAEALEAQRKLKEGNVAQQEAKKKGPQEVDYENRTTLVKHIVKWDWKAVIKRALKHPEEASTWISTKGVNGVVRFLPVHKACVLNPPVEVVEALISAYPDGAKSYDQDGWLPLHCAAYYCASESITTLLIQANPAACKAKDEEGRLPLHYACMKGSSREIVEKLVNACPKSAQLKDDEGLTALHLACGNGCSSEVLEILISACSKSAQSRDDQGRIPLHHLCCNSEVNEDNAEHMVRILLKAFKSGVSVQDDQGKLPMHYACENRNVGKAALSLLFTAYPKAIDVKDGYGYTPITTAQAFCNDMDVLLENLSLKEKHSMSGSVVNTATSNDSRENDENCGGKANIPQEARQAGSPLKQHKEGVEIGQEDVFCSPQTLCKKDVDKELVSRLKHLENVLASFGQAMKEMQSKLERGEDPRLLLASFSSESNKLISEAM